MPEDAMRSAQAALKLAELHFKTDRQLAEIVGRSVEHGLMLLRAAGAPGAGGDSALSEQFLARARACRDEAERLLPTIQAEALRLPLQAKLDELRQVLSGFTGGRRPAAYC